MKMFRLTDFLRAKLETDTKFLEGISPRAIQKRIKDDVRDGKLSFVIADGSWRISGETIENVLPKKKGTDEKSAQGLFIDFVIREDANFETWFDKQKTEGNFNFGTVLRGSQSKVALETLDSAAFQKRFETYQQSLQPKTQSTVSETAKSLKSTTDSIQLKDVG